MHQRGYVQELLARFKMIDCKPVSTPVDTGTKLRKNLNPTQEDSKLPYRELVGALTYLSVSTRPDIAFAISCLGQFNNCYGTEHWKAAKRVLRYLKGTPDVGISYGRDHQSLKGYVDADWGSCTEDRRSYTGYLFMLGGSPISWDARKQRTVALSTTEAEYMALSECTKEALYLQRFLRELDFDKMAELMIYCDNHNALKLAENPVFHAKNKAHEDPAPFCPERSKRENIRGKFTFQRRNKWLTSSPKHCQNQNIPGAQSPLNSSYRTKEDPPAIRTRGEVIEHDLIN